MRNLKWHNIARHTASLGVIYLLILLYLRKIISPGIPGSSVNLDLYTHSIVVKAYADALKHGVIPLGIYWYPKIYGGTPATTYQGGFEVVDFLYMLIFNLTGSIDVTIKSIIFLSLILACTTSYLYFIQILGKENRYIVLSTTIYTFSCYWINEILNGHLSLIFGAAIIPLVLTFFEKTILNTSRRNIIVFGVALSIMTLSELQITFFTLMFIAFRLLYFTYTRQASRKAVSAFILSLIVALMITAPLIIPFITIYKSARTDVLSFWAAPPYTYFTRVMHKAYGLEPYYYYIGVIPLTTTLIYFLKVFNLKNVNSSVRSFIFFFLSSIFFMWYSSVQYAPISIAHLVRATIPFAISIRVASRSIILASLSIGVCTGIACNEIVNLLRRGILLKILPIMLSLIVFIDLAWGIEPTTTPVFNDLEGFNYIKNQQEDFNVLGYPPVWSLPYYISTYINKSILSANPILTVYNQQINNQNELYNRFIKVYSTAYVSNGGFEDKLNNSKWSINSSWNSKALRTDLESREGVFSLYLIVNSSKSMEYIKLSQNITETPIVTRDMYMTISINPIVIVNTSLRVEVNLREAGTGAVRSLYIYDYKGELEANRWSDIVRNMSSYAGGGVWQVTNISIEVYSLMGRFEAFIDSVNIYHDEDDVPLKLGYYGVKYVYVHKDRDFISRYVAYNDEQLTEDICVKVGNLIRRLEASRSFEKVYADEKLDIFRNKYFKGFIFPLGEAYLNYSWVDLNTLRIRVRAESNTTIIVCQPYHHGWTAAGVNGGVEISDFNGVMALNVNQGIDELTMHFSKYEESLVKTGLSWTAALIFILIIGLRRWNIS